MYDTNIKQQLNLLHIDMKKHNLIKTRTEIKNAIAFAQMTQKRYYDRKHQSMFFQLEDYALLRLHHEYEVFSAKRKLDQQNVELFKIIKKIERLIYQLDISQHWRVHSIFIIVQLKSASNLTMNSFHRSRSDESSFVFVEDDTNIFKSFELKKMLNKRVIRKERYLIIEYLVKWSEYESEHDMWLNIKNLDNVKELIQNYEKTIVVFKELDHHLNSSRIFKSRRERSEWVKDDDYSQRERWVSFI